MEQVKSIEVHENFEGEGFQGAEAWPDGSAPISFEMTVPGVGGILGCYSWRGDCHRRNDPKGRGASVVALIVSADDKMESGAGGEEQYELELPFKKPCWNLTLPVLMSITCWQDMFDLGFYEC